MYIPGRKTEEKENSNRAPLPQVYSVSVLLLMVGE